MKYFSSQASFSFARLSSTKGGVLQLQLPKAPRTHSLSWPEGRTAFFFPLAVFSPSWQVGWGERSCPCESLPLHLAVVSARVRVSVRSSPLCRQHRAPLKVKSQLFLNLALSLFRVPESFLSPFPPQSGWVPLFPSVKALGLICFPGWGKTQECDVEKGLSSFPVLLPSFISPHFFFPPLFLLLLFLLPLSWTQSQKCQDNLSFDPNQTQTTAAAGNQGNFTKNLTDQQNTTSFPLRHIESGLGGEGEGCSLGWGKVLKHYTSS